MSHLYYRLAETEDPEERLEDAVLYKALHDCFGSGLTTIDMDAPAPTDGLFLGRGKNREVAQENLLAAPGLKYWNDPAFKDAITRSFMITDLKGAEAEVDRLHEQGKDAFVKSTRQKHCVSRVDQGQSLYDALGGMVYSFMDLEDCLMVQEAMEMNYERRFLVMNGKVVTQSPVAWHLTPMSRSWIQDDTGFSVEDLHYKTPNSHETRFSPDGTKRMTEFAQKIADASDTAHLCIDLAIIGDDPSKDPIEIIEFNPMQPGAVGLYACDPKQIAKAVWKAMSPELSMVVEARRDGLLEYSSGEELSKSDQIEVMVKNADPLMLRIFGGEDSLRESYATLFADLPDDTAPDDELAFQDREFVDEEPFEDDSPSP